MKLSHLALAISTTIAGQALAQTAIEDSLQLDDHVITGSRFAQPKDAVLAANSVFTRQDIESLQVRSVPELLNHAPGVQAHMSGGILTYSIRGTSSNQTLVLVDGQRIASASAGIARLDYLSIDNIERVEIIRGPRSSIYGADAIGGVIQIFTRRGEQGLQASMRFGLDSNQTYERNINLSGGNQRSQYVLGASLDESRGHDLTSDNWGVDRDHDGQRNKAMFLRFDHNFSEDWSAGLSLNEQRGKNEYDDAFEFIPSTPEDQFRVRSYNTYLQGQLTDVWQSRLELGRSEDRNKSQDSAEVDGFIKTYRHSASWLNHVQLDPAQHLTLGGDWQRDRLSSSNAFSKTRRENIAGFAQHSWSTDKFSTEFGIRHDDNQHFGNQSTWNGAVAIPSGDHQRWILSYATGFRAPTFNDMYPPPGWGGNPDLDPESSKTWELQWRGDLYDTLFETSFYRTDITDLIAWSGSTFKMENIDQARINGFEAAITRNFFGWISRSALSIIDPRDRNSGHTLQLRAKRSLSVDMERQFDDLSVGATWQLFSQRYANLGNTETLAGYGTLDLRASWQKSMAWRWDLKLSNALDRDYHLSNYQRSTGPAPAPSIMRPYQEQGRQALIAVTWTPKI